MVTEETESPRPSAVFEARQEPSQHRIGMDQMLSIYFGFLCEPGEPSGPPGTVVFHRHGKEKASPSNLCQFLQYGTREGRIGNIGTEAFDTIEGFFSDHAIDRSEERRVGRKY